MSDYYSLVRQKEKTKSRMSAAQDSNADLQEQIDRLKEAKRIIKPKKTEDGVNLLWSFCLTPVFCRCAHLHPARDVAHPECALTDQIVA